MDPPYNHEYEKEVLTWLSTLSMVRDEGIVVVEASRQTDMSYVTDLGFTVIREKIYKTNKHVFLQYN